MQNAGEIRGNYEVRITGVSYIPPDIYEDEAKQLVDNAIREYPSVLDRSIYLALIISKRQFCCNGNKRTALMVCNHVLVNEDSGYIFAPICYDDDHGTIFDSSYVSVLTDYYDDHLSLDAAIDYMSNFLIPID